MPKLTVGDIWKGRENIESYVASTKLPNFAKKKRFGIFQSPKFKKLEKACCMWFLQQRSKGDPLSGTLIQEKVLQLSPSIYPDSEGLSVASSGWLHRFV